MLWYSLEAPWQGLFKVGIYVRSEVYVVVVVDIAFDKVLFIFNQ